MAHSVSDSTEDRHWDSDGPPLRYSIIADADDETFYGVQAPAPPLLTSRLGSHWLFGPHFSSKLRTTFEQQTVCRTPIKSIHRDTEDTSTMSHALYKTWYAKHISDDLKLKYIAPLSPAQLDRVIEPLTNICAHPAVKDVVVPVETFNPLLKSLEGSALNKDSPPIESEEDLQQVVYPIFQSIVQIVSTLFTLSHVQPPPNTKTQVSHTFCARHNVGHNQSTVHNTCLLRTSTKPQTSLTADYYVYLNYEQTASSVKDSNKRKLVLRDSLLNPGNIVILGAEFKLDASFEMPTSRLAYLDVTCKENHASIWPSNDLKFNIFDFQRFPDGSPERADFDPERLQALDQILGTDLPQDISTAAELYEASIPSTNPPSHTRLWAQMVSQGLYMGLIMDWCQRNHLCVRDPRTGTLYISEPLKNPLVGTSFEDRLKSLELFSTKMDNGEFPWKLTNEPYSVMNVIGGAILTGFHLLHPKPLPPLFVPVSETTKGHWEAAKMEMEARRTARHDAAKSMSISELESYKSQHQSHDRGPSGPSAGHGSSQGGASRHGNFTSPGGGSNPAGQSDGLGHGCTSHGRKRPIGSGSAAEKIFLGIFDGDVYHSKEPEIFYNWSKSQPPRSNSPSRETALSSGRSPDNMSRTSSPVSIFNKTPTLSPKSDTISSPQFEFAATTDFTSIQVDEHQGKHDIPQANPTAPKIFNIDLGTEMAIVLLNSFIVKGAVGDIWQGYATFPDQPSPVPIAAKLAFTSQGMDSLQHEHDIYQYLGRDPNLPVPVMYGFYKNIPDDIGQQVGLLLLSWVNGVAPQCKEDVQESKSLITNALTKLHHIGVVHGDIAPRNILIDEGKVTLIDFDRARLNSGSCGLDMYQLESMCE